ncbi:helix-turn-helix domain-containing protein [Nocardia jiangsuensis]|uniref:Helix-turn-helix domain-containing protein n=1 Tax=Nocardia jiangsuensis TaxID=1691563 RepID=A0ABV8DTP0_9NOCA
MGVIGKWTGREVTVLRQALGMRQEAFAAHTGVSVELVRKWEKRKETITLSVPYAARMDRKLQEAGEAVAERFWKLLSLERSTVGASSLGLGGEGPVQRKRFLQVMTGSATGLALAAHSDSRRGIGSAPELMDYFRNQLAGHYTADALLGPVHLIPTVQAQTELLIAMAREGNVAIRSDLLEIGASFAALLGWLYQDAGKLSSSLQWRHTTLALAHRSGRPRIISYALSNMAMLALDNGDGAMVVEYAQAAQAVGTSLSPKCRVLALQHEAHGHAMCGERAAADRLLDKLDALIPKVDDQDPWGNACRRTPHYVHVQRATCYGRTGAKRDGVAAADLWDEVMDSMPDRARRDNAVFRARQAAALAKVPDPDRAVRAAAEAAEAYASTGSVRLRRELEVVGSRAAGWSDSSAGRELRTILGSVT